MPSLRCAACRERRAGRSARPARTRADHRHPVLGAAGDVVLQRDENRRADQRPPERAHAAQHRHDDEIAGEVESQRARIGEIVEQRIERAGDADEEARDHEREPDVQLDRDAEEARAPLVLADGDQRAPERRSESRAIAPTQTSEDRRARNSRRPCRCRRCRSWRSRSRSAGDASR